LSVPFLASALSGSTASGGIHIPENSLWIIESTLRPQCEDPSAKALFAGFLRSLPQDGIAD
jgi:hypothetical protein